MEYERIHKVQMGVMSPTKLRMKKLLGSNGAKKREEGSKSPRASPSKLAAAAAAADHLKNSLLAQDRDEGRLEDPGGNSGNGNGNANAGGFEFFGEERKVMPQPAAGLGPFLRQVPSKWNDAEKWIVGRHVVHSNPIFAKAAAHGQGGVRVPAESAVSADTKKSHSSSLSSRSAPTGPTDQCSSVRGPYHKRLRASASPGGASAGDLTVISSLQSVSMRDIGTEMTPIASQEQSRTGTPAGAATPSLSPLCSVPSSPREGRSASPSASEKELKITIRREIAALGLQLGKMKIASWASKEEFSRAPGEDRTERAEFEARAAEWEESRKCKLMSRYQRKEMKIQEWESHQKAKFEAKMRSAEAQAEQMKARAQHNLARRLSVLQRAVDAKQAAAEAGRNRQAATLARQAERIRSTGRAPPQCRCCGWVL